MHQPAPHTIDVRAVLRHYGLPPAAFLLTAALLSGSLFPLYLLIQYRTGEWLDVLIMGGVWAAVVVLYCLPVGAFLFRPGANWLARLVLGYVISIPFYFLTVWIVLALLTSSLLPASLGFHPATAAAWLAYLYPTPIFYLIVLMLYFLVRAGGQLARIIPWGSAAVFSLSWVGVIAWTQAMDSYRWPAQASASPVRADIVNVKIVDAPHERIIEGQNVRIENGKIVQIVAASADPGGWPKIDAHGGYLVPGLIDVHVHVLTPLRSLLADFDFMYLVQSIFADFAPHRRALLESGVTTIRDLGGPAQHAVALRSALARHELLGPRMLAVGALVTSPHGHPVATIWTDEISRQGAIVATDSASLIGGLEHNYKAAQPDAVKIIYGTIGMTRETISKELLGQAVAWAQAKHLPSVVHIDTTQEASDAVAAGATGIEHVATMASLPDALTAAMLAHHTFADPTFGEFRAALMLTDTVPDEIERRMNEKYALVRKLAASGVPLTIGTDFPTVPGNGDYQDELDEFVKAGFTPAQILTYATANNAAYLAKADELGSIAPDHDADMFLVRDNPLDHISALRKPLWVMLAGQVVAGNASPLAPEPQGAANEAARL